MKQYRTINNLVGWLTFIIAATVYCLTIEPTASFWDCPEFITTGYKLEVGHPPGAPFFMLVANLFSQFASDVTTVAKMVNYMSARNRDRNAEHTCIYRLEVLSKGRRNTKLFSIDCT